MKERKPFNIILGDRIRSARENANITQERLAEYIDVSVQYISDLERGVVGTSLPTFTNICRVLNVTSDSLLFGIAESPRKTLYENKLATLSDEEYLMVERSIDLILKALAYPGHKE